MRCPRTSAMSRVATIFAGSLPRRKTNGNFRECGNAADVDADRRLWAGCVGMQAPDVRGAKPSDVREAWQVQLNLKAVIQRKVRGTPDGPGGMNLPAKAPIGGDGVSSLCST